MRCLYGLIKGKHGCNNEAVGFSRFCLKHIKKQQDHAQRILKRGKFSTLEKEEV